MNGVNGKYKISKKKQLLVGLAIFFSVAGIIAGIVFVPSEINFIDSLVLLSLIGFSFGVVINLKLEEGKSNLFAGIILLAYPVLFLIVFLGGNSSSWADVIKELRITLSFFSFLIGLGFGTHSGAWIKQGLRKLGY